MRCSPDRHRRQEGGGPARAKAGPRQEVACRRDSTTGGTGGRARGGVPARPAAAGPAGARGRRRSGSRPAGAAPARGGRGRAACLACGHPGAGGAGRTRPDRMAPPAVCQRRLRPRLAGHRVHRPGRSERCGRGRGRGRAYLVRARRRSGGLVGLDSRRGGGRRRVHRPLCRTRRRRDDPRRRRRHRCRGGTPAR